MTYTVLFFPFSFRNLYYSLKGDNASDEEDSVRDISGDLTSALVYLSPLIDSSIYIFIRRDKRDTMEVFPCCKKPLTKLREFQDRRRDASPDRDGFIINLLSSLKRELHLRGIFLNHTCPCIVA